MSMTLLAEAAELHRRMAEEVDYSKQFPFYKVVHHMMNNDEFILSVYETLDEYVDIGKLHLPRDFVTRIFLCN